MSHIIKGDANHYYWDESQISALEYSGGTIHKGALFFIIQDIGDFVNLPNFKGHIKSETIRSEVFL